MYFPKSQITPNLYTNGNEFVIKNTKENYIGFYWKLSSGKIFTGRTPQDPPTQELIISPLLATNESNETNGLKVALFRYDVDPEGFDVYIEEGLYNASSIELYSFLKNIDVNSTISLPYYLSPPPTQQDYQTGEFRRCFCKKIDEIIYLEIDKDTYSKLIKKDPTIAFQYYQAFNIPWQLTGNKEQVFTTNKNIVELTMKQQKLPQFDKYLKEDYLKYYK
jgi:hypothetical protein